MLSRIAASTLLLTLFTVHLTQAQIPRTLSYQAIAEDGSGNLLPDGPHTVTFSLYEAATGGSPIYSETQTVEVLNGTFSATIGQATTIPAGIDFDDTYYLGIAIDGASEMVPRTPFTSSPYALNAAHAEIADALSFDATGIVRSINNHAGDVILKRGAGISIQSSSTGDTITISSTGGSAGITELQNLDGSLSISGANGPITLVSVAVDGISSDNIQDGSVTSDDLADAAISPSKINGSGADSGDVLMYDGNDVIFGGLGGGSGSLSLPFNAVVDTGTAFAITNRGGGRVAHFRVTDTASNDHALVGEHVAEAGWDGPAGLYGQQSGDAGIGVYGRATGVSAQGIPSRGVYGRADSGYGVYGYSTTKAGLHGETAGPGDGLQAFNTGMFGRAGYFRQYNSSNDDPTIEATTPGDGSAVIASRTKTSGTASTMAATNASTSNGTGLTGGATGVLGHITSASAGGWSAGVRGINSSTSGNGIGVVGFQNGSGWGVAGEAVSGIGVRATAGNGGNALLAAFTGTNVSTTTSNNIAIFQAPPRTGGAAVNQARIDQTGRGYFNGGTTNQGADVAELMNHEGQRDWYEPGDVLAISTTSDVRLEKSREPYSTLVVGVYATNPGVRLTEDHIDADHSAKVPCGVIGIIPTKVIGEGGSIERGDILVTSSKPGYAMKADPERALQNPGCIIGKALQEFEGDGTGVIKVLVNVR